MCAKHERSSACHLVVRRRFINKGDDLCTFTDCESGCRAASHFMRPIATTIYIWITKPQQQYNNKKRQIKLNRLYDIVQFKLSHLNSNLIRILSGWAWTRTTREQQHIKHRPNHSHYHFVIDLHWNQHTFTPDTI